MDEKRFKELFDRYLEDNLSPDELLEFQQAVQDENNTFQIDGLLKDAYSNPAYAETNSDAEQNAYDQVFNEINAHSPPVKRFINYRWMAGIAALFFTALAAGLYFYNNQHKAASYASEIKPGTNKATLILANGRKIVLSEALNGTLATESGVKVTKDKTGQLTYTISAKPQGETNNISYNTLTTARGEQYQVILPDGSHVWLNAASSLRYPTTFTNNERMVDLTGEGYFEVAHNPASPFKVHTATQDVEVLGTHFNIKSYTDEPAIKTTLLEGSIKIKLSASPTISKILKPGEQANNTGSDITVKKIDTEESVAWKNGYFMFEEESIGSVMRKVSRWYNVDIVYEDIDPNEAFEGSITRFTNVSKVLEMLQKAGTVHFKIEGRKITVTK